MSENSFTQSSSILSLNLTHRTYIQLRMSVEVAPNLLTSTTTHDGSVFVSRQKSTKFKDAIYCSFFKDRRYHLCTILFFFFDSEKVKSIRGEYGSEPAHNILYFGFIKSKDRLYIRINVYLKKSSLKLIVSLASNEQKKKR